MQAHFTIRLPFDVLVVTDIPYDRYVSERGGFTIIHDLPSISEERKARGDVGGFTIDGRAAFQCDTLNIRFLARSFDRTANGQPDPPLDVVDAEVASFLERLRFVTLAPQIRAVRLTECTWNVEYLEDDNSSLPREAGMLRGRGGIKKQFAFVGVRPSVWDATFSLPDDFVPPVWHSLLLDANGALPHIGSAIALSCTALEVFAPEMLNELANRHHLIHPELWKWIWSRGFQKKPALEEQFDGLLSLLSGHSLKEDNTLWEALQKLVRARNSFVHQGEATLGGKSKEVVTLEAAKQIVADAYKICLKVREWLPEQLQWKILTEPFELQIRMAVATDADPQDSSDNTHT
jgi:hypothetical protein